MKNVYILLISLLLLTSCASTKEIESVDTLLYKENKFLFDEEIHTKDLFKNEDYIIKDEILNTDTIGDKDIVIHYTLDNKNYKENFKYTVIDNEKPLIWMSNSYTYKTGSEDNLLEKIICADNYDKKPTCFIEGDYDFNTEGTYKLKLIAVDSSNNKDENDFTLNIKDEIVSSKNNYSITTTNIEDIIDIHKNDNTMIGIDVSKYQGEIDFEKVKNAGVEFVIIRLGYQKYFDDDYELDPFFISNIESALENNLKVGVYFYSYATTVEEAKDQAEYVIKNIKKYNVTMPIAFDWENFKHWNEINISLTDLRKTSYAFSEEIEKAGYTSVQYGSKNYLNAFWEPIKTNTWLAHYVDKTNYDKDYLMWQLCDDGKVDGIYGNVDIDVYYKQ